jgi:heat-inducible transcriptional repressor
VNCQFKYLELVSLQESLALGIFVLRGARIKQRLINFEEAISQARLTAIVNRLNSVYSGLTMSEILAKKVALSLIEQQLINYLIKIMQAEDEHDYAETYLDGLHFILSQPEFSRSQRAKSLLELIDQRNLPKVIAPQGLQNQAVQVIIGGENKAEAIQDYSVVISRYGLPNQAAGTISVVGPTRMPYGRAISTISYLSSLLSRLTAELYGEEPALS